MLKFKIGSIVSINFSSVSKRSFKHCEHCQNHFYLLYVACEKQMKTLRFFILFHNLTIRTFFQYIYKYLSLPRIDDKMMRQALFCCDLMCDMEFSCANEWEMYCFREYDKNSRFCMKFLGSRILVQRIPFWFRRSRIGYRIPLFYSLLCKLQSFHSYFSEYFFLIACAFLSYE